MPRPTLFAHRGSSHYAPENTLAAFKLAIEHKADAIELDTKLSVDRIPVVIHDPTVDRTTQGTGAVREKTFAELRELDAGESFDSAYRGEKIPSLEEVFEEVGQKIFINIELTNPAAPTDPLPWIVAELIRKHNLQKRVMFSSFNPLALRRAWRELPEVPRGLLAFPGGSGALARSWLRGLVPCEAIHPELGDVNEKFVRRIHRGGQRVHVYTVNRSEDMRRLFLLGVDGIFTDDPVLARQVLLEEKPE